MKKRTVKMMSLAVVALLMASMVIPVMAYNGDGTSKSGYYYRFTITKNATSGTAYIGTPYSPAYVTAKAVNTLDCKINGKPVKVSNSLTGYASVSATAGNTLPGADIAATGLVVATTAELKVNGEIVVFEGECFAD